MEREESLPAADKLRIGLSSPAGRYIVRNFRYQFQFALLNDFEVSLKK
jgi:hypothetical protein